MKPRDQAPTTATGTATPPGAGRDNPTPVPRGGDPDTRHRADDTGTLEGEVDTSADDALDLALDDVPDDEVPSADVRSDSYDDEANERR